MTVCGAKKRQGDGACQRPAGWGTDHVGDGRCKLHGGSTPIRHGRYSQIERPRFKDKIERFEADPDPLNLAPEVALLRAFVEDLIERWDEIYGPDGALLAWHESFGKTDDNGQSINTNPKPRQLPDFSAVSAVVDKVGSMVDRIQKQKAEGMIKLSTLQRYINQAGVEVVNALKQIGVDADTSSRLVRAIEERWGSIQLDAEPASGRRTP